jgi:hypothetical protein
MSFRSLAYFQSCFVFEGLPPAFKSSCSFSLQLSVFAIPCAQSLGLFLSWMLLYAVAPLTLGFALMPGI